MVLTATGSAAFRELGLPPTTKLVPAPAPTLSLAPAFVQAVSELTTNAALSA